MIHPIKPRQRASFCSTRSAICAGELDGNTTVRQPCSANRGANLLNLTPMKTSTQLFGLLLNNIFCRKILQYIKRIWATIEESTAKPLIS